jgi:SWI/SNF-related matrix-associated actin-dependent regulator of chromatin subfamily A member 5
MRQISKQHVLMLTGTPVQNNLHELFALLNFMFPDVFTDSDVFDKAFNLSQVSGSMYLGHCC